MSQGNFDCGNLLEIQAMADAIWQDNRRNVEFIPNADAAKAIIENQTVQMTELQNPDKDREVSLKWLNACAITTADCGDECDITGPELEGDCQTYSLTKCKEASFIVKELESRTSIFEAQEKIAKGMLMAKKELDEWWAAQIIAEVDSFKGVNAYTGTPGSVSGTSTTIQAPNWTLGLMSYFMLVQKKNKFAAPFLLNGENLFQASMNAEWNAQNAAGSGDNVRRQLMPMYWDVFNMDDVLGAGRTLMIDRGATALVTKAYYRDFTAANPWKRGDHIGMRWSEPSMHLSGVTYDVFYKITCSGNEIYHSFKLKTKGDVFLNPQGCNKTNTGVLEFKCA